MGRSADDRLNLQYMRQVANNSDLSREGVDALLVEAEGMRGEGVDQKHAIRILTGQTRLPFGTHRPKGFTQG